MNRFVAALPRQKIIAPKKELYLPSRRLLCDPARENARCRLFMESEALDPRLYPWARIKQYRGPFRIVYPTMATITLVSGQTAAGEGISSSLTISLPNNPTQGNLVVVGVAYVAGTATCADGASNSFTNSPAGQVACQAAVGGYLNVFYLANAPSNANKSIIISGLSGGGAAWAAEFSGAATSSPVDTYNSYTGSTSSTAISEPTIVPNFVGDLFFAVANFQQTMTSVNSPFSIVKSIESGDGAAYYINSGSSSTTPTWNQSPAGELAALMVAFKAAADSFALDGQSLIFM